MNEINFFAHYLDKTVDLECYFCCQYFNSQERIPLMVCSNQHVYCQQCLDNQIFKNKQEDDIVLCHCKQRIIRSSCIRIKFIQKVLETFHQYFQKESKIKIRSEELAKEQKLKEEHFEFLKHQVKRYREMLNQKIEEKEAILTRIHSLELKNQKHQEQINNHQNRISKLSQQSQSIIKQIQARSKQNSKQNLNILVIDQIQILHSQLMQQNKSGIQSISIQIQKKHSQLQNQLLHTVKLEKNMFNVFEEQLLTSNLERAYDIYLAIAEQNKIILPTLEWSFEAQKTFQENLLVIKNKVINEIHQKQSECIQFIECAPLNIINNSIKKKLTYFDLKDYFKINHKYNDYEIQVRILKESLNLNILRKQIQEYKQLRQQKGKNQLWRIYKQINDIFGVLGFTMNFQIFQKSVLNKNSNFMGSFCYGNRLIKLKENSFANLSKQNMIISLTANNLLNKNIYNYINLNTILKLRESINGTSISNIDKQSKLNNAINKQINYQFIQMKIKEINQIMEKDQFENLINTDLSTIGISITSNQYLNKQKFIINKDFNFKNPKFKKIFNSQSEFILQLKKLKLFDWKLIKNSMKKINKQASKDCLCICKIQQEIFEVADEFKNITQLHMYLVKPSTDYSYLRDQSMQQFVFRELQKKNIFLKLFQNIEKRIRSNLIFLTDKSLKNMFDQTNEELWIFNQQLKQVSYKLSSQLVSLVHLFTIYLCSKKNPHNINPKQKQIIKQNKKNNCIQDVKSVKNQREIFKAVDKTKESKNANQNINDSFGYIQERKRIKSLEFFTNPENEETNKQIMQNQQKQKMYLQKMIQFFVKKQKNDITQYLRFYEKHKSKSINEIVGLWSQNNSNTK